MSSTSDIIIQSLLPCRTPPKRFIKNQIPDSILNDASLNSAISLLPSNYSFELPKCIWRIRTLNATSVALQFREGLLMYSCIISDILTTFTSITHCIILGDVTYGACGKMSWGIVLGTLGRQGNPRILERLEKKMGEKGLDWTVILMSELSPARIALFEDLVEAWIQIACPWLSIDWGDALVRPLLTPFEAEIALGDLPGWWERKPRENVDTGLGCYRDNGSGSLCKNENDSAEKEGTLDYPMDYYAQDGGEWNSCYAEKPSRGLRRNVQSCKGNGGCC